MTRQTDTSGRHDRLLQEFRFAVRRLRRAPVHTGAALATLGLGIAGLLVVGALSRVVLTPLPFPDSERLYAVWETEDERRRWVAPANYIDWRATSEAFEGLAAHDTRGANVTIGDEATRELVAVVSGNFFEVLGLATPLGRAFDPTYDPAFPDRVAVLSHDAWVTRFGSSPAVLGETVRVEDVTYEIVGVAAPGPTFPDPGLFAWLRSRSEAPEIRGFDGDLTSMRDAWYFQVVGRLAPGVHTGTARSEMRSIASALAERHPETNEGAGVELVELRSETVADFDSTVLALVLAVALILFASGTNVLQLAMARAEATRHDRAVRVSIGASRRDLLGSAVLEGALMGLGAALLGASAARLGVTTTVARLGDAIPRSHEVLLTPTLVVAGVALGTLVGVAVAVVVERRADGSGGVEPARALRAFAPSSGRVLIATQVAVAIAVLAGTALLGRSFVALGSVEPGFDVDRLTTFRVAMPDALERPYTERVARYGQLAATLREGPGVVAVGVGSETPLTMGPRAGVRVLGDPETNDPPDAGWQPVMPGYLQAIGVPARRGRMLDSSDGPDAIDVAVVNEAFVRDVLGGRDPLTHRVTMGLDGHDRPLTIVGVVGNTRTRGPALPAGAMLYRPLAQTDRFTATSLLFAIRTAPGVTGGTGVPRIVREQARGMPVYAEATGEQLLRPFRASQSMLMIVLGVFAATAISIGMVGVYGVSIHRVRQRRREIGVRLALGASSGQVAGEVVGAGMRTALLGVVPGVVLALLLGRGVEGLLFEVGAADPVTLAAVSSAVLALTASALLLPARLAAGVDPARATRGD